MTMGDNAWQPHNQKSNPYFKTLSPLSVSRQTSITTTQLCAFPATLPQGHTFPSHLGPLSFEALAVGEKVTHLCARVFRFSQQWCCRFKSSVTWRCVCGRAAPHVSKSCNASTFRIKHTRTIPLDCLFLTMKALRHIGTNRQINVTNHKIRLFIKHFQFNAHPTYATEITVGCETFEM